MVFKPHMFGDIGVNPTGIEDEIAPAPVPTPHQPADSEFDPEKFARGPTIDDVKKEKTKDVPPAADDVRRSLSVADSNSLKKQNEIAIKRASQITGLPIELLRNVDPSLLVTSQATDWDKVAEDSPTVTKLIGKNPNNAAIAKDNVKELQEIERVRDTAAMKKMRALAQFSDAQFRSRNYYDKVTQLRDARLGARTGVVHAISEGAQFGSEQMEMGKLYSRFYLNNDQSVKPRLDYLEKKWGGREAPSGFVNWMASTGSKQVSQLWGATKRGAQVAIPSAMAGAIVGTAGGPLAPVTSTSMAVTTGAAGFKFGMALEFFEMTTGLALKTIDDIETESGEKIDPVTRNIYGVAIGGVSAYLEVLGFSAMARVFAPAVGGVKNKIFNSAINAAMKDKNLRLAMADVGKAYATSITTEARTEALQTSAELLGTWLAVHTDEFTSDREFDDSDKELLTANNFKQIWDAAIEGGAGALMLGAAPTSVNATIVAQDVQLAKDHIQGLTELNDEVQKSKMNTESPESMTELLQMMGTGDESIDAQAAEALWESGAEDVFKKIGVSRQQIEESVQLGDDIVLSVNDLVTKLTQAEFETIAPILRASSASMSMQDANKARSSLEAKKNASLIKENSKDLTEFNKTLKRVNKAVTNTGRTQEEADAFTGTIGAFAVRMAQRSVDPKGTIESIAKSLIDKIDVRRDGDVREGDLAQDDFTGSTIKGGIATLDGERIGFISYDLETDPIAIRDEETGELTDGESEPYVLIEKVAVDVEHGGKGLGRRLLREALGEIRTRHPDKDVRLSVQPEEEQIDLSNLIEFYESEGFDVLDNDSPSPVMQHDGVTFNPPSIGDAPKQDSIVKRVSKFLGLSKQPKEQPTIQLDKFDMDTVNIVGREELGDTFESRAEYYQAAFHGTPHKFDEFTLDNIGSGEGNQAFGWGLYFTSEKKIAEWYRETLAGESLEFSTYSGKKLTEWADANTDEAIAVRYILRAVDFDGATTFDLATEFAEIDMRRDGVDPSIIENNIDWQELNIPLEGDVKNVDLPESDELLQRDKKLNEQPSGVQEKLRDIIPDASWEKMGSKWSGGQFYDAWLGDSTNKRTDPEMSRLLAKNGIQGLEYPAQQGIGDGRNFVIWDETAIEILSPDATKAEAQTFFQTQGGPRGSVEITEESYIINLFENSDESTLMHETGHIFLEEIRSMVEAGVAEDSLVKDYESITEYIGLDEDGSIPRQSHEKFARTFELWLMEGKAPSAALDKAFTRFRNWLTSVYKSVKGAEGNAVRGLGIQAGQLLDINDGVREVFERMLATEEEIQEIAGINELSGLSELELEALEGITDKDRAEIAGAREAGIQEAVAKVEGTRRRAVAKNRSKWRTEAEDEVDTMQVYVASGQIKEDSGLNLAWLKDYFDPKTIAELRRRGLVHKRGLVDETDADSFDTASFDRDAEIEELTLGDSKSRSGIPLRNGDAKSIANEIDDIGGILPQDKNLKFTGEYEDAPQLKGNLSSLYDGDGQAPDSVAQELESLGIGDGTTVTMWRLLSEDVDTRTDNAVRLKDLKEGKFTDDIGPTGDEYATINGYGSPQEMVQDIITKPSRAQAIKELVQAKVLQEESKVLGIDSIIESDQFQKHMDKVGKGIRDTMLKKKLKAGDSVPNNKDVKRIARDRIEAMPISQAVGTSRLMGNMKTAVKKMRNALLSNRKDRLETAMKHNIDARQFFEMARISIEIRKDVDKLIKKAKQIRKAKAGSIAEQHHENALAIIERYNLVTGKSKLRTDEGFVKMRLEDLLEGIGEDFSMNVSVQFSIETKSEGFPQDYRTMNFAQFNEVDRLLTQVFKAGRDINNRKIADSKLTVAEAGVTASESILRNKKTRKNSYLSESDSERRISNYGSFIASHRKIASIVKEMDGFEDAGVMWDLFIRPMNKAADMEAVQREQATIELAAIYELYSKRELGNMQKRESVAGMQMSKMEQLMIVLNMGNDDNYTKLVDGRTNVTAEQVSIVANGLDKRDIEFVNRMWEYIDSFWAETSAVNRRVSGVTPDKVTAVPLSVAAGELTGGYFPLSYDGRLSDPAAGIDQDDKVGAILRGSKISSTTKHGSRLARTKGVTLPIKLNFSVINEHIGAVIHDTTHYEFIRDSNRLLKNVQINDAIRSTYGVNVLNQFKYVLQDIAVGEEVSTNAMESFFGHIRIGSSIAAMGWSLTTALVQPLGYTQSIKVLGTRYAGLGIQKYFVGAVKQQGLTTWVHGKSDMMRLRAKTQQREINEIRNTVLKQKGSLRNKFDEIVDTATLGKVSADAIGNSFFYMVVKTQQMVDMPTWLGAYEKYSVQFPDDESKVIALSDQAVLDSQGGGQIKDLAAITRGNNALKLFTNFYSFFNVTYNLTAESVNKFRYGDKTAQSIGALVVDYMLLYAIPASLGMLFFETIRGDEPEEELWKRLLNENLSYMASTMVGLREIGSAIKGFQSYNGPSGSRFFNEANKLVKQMQQGELDAAFFKSAFNASGLIFHHPTTQITRTIDGIVAMADGKTTWAAAPLLGKPRK